jgi:long-chain acyl-CoA synthetase
MKLEIATLPQLLRKHAHANPSRLSQRHKQRGIWREYSFADVQRNVREIALGMHQAGVKAGETIAIIGENEPQHYWAEYAAHALGCKVVSMYPDLTSEEVAYLLDDSEAVILFAQDQEQVDKGLDVRNKTLKMRHIVYWDETGMWSYNDPILHTFDGMQRQGREIHQRNGKMYDALVDAGAPDDIAVLS